MNQSELPRVSQEYVEKLFAHLYADLGQRTTIKNEGFRLYNQLNMTRLLRQLLIDGGSGVLYQVNRYHKLPIQFIVGHIGPPPTKLETISEIYKNSLPDLNDFPPGHYLHPYKIDGYLAYSPLTLADLTFSVGDVIRYVANQFGGVHLSPYLEDERHQLLAKFNDRIMITGDGIILKCVDQIAKTTLKALSPLMKTIQTKYDPI